MRCKATALDLDRETAIDMMLKTFIDIACELFPNKCRRQHEYVALLDFDPRAVAERLAAGASA